MLVSVVIPVFGRRRSLEFALSSVTAQTGLAENDVEIIIVDDASPDPVSIPTEHNNGNIKVVRLSQNVGPAGARNAGIQAGQGEFIAFLDSDDMWRPEKLAQQSNLAKQLANEHDLSRIAIACGFFIPNRLGQQIELRIPKTASQQEDFLGGCWMCPGSTLFVHRSAFEQVGFFDKRLRRLEDYEWLLRFAANGGQLSVSRYGGAVIAPSSGSKLKPVADAVEIIRDTVATSRDLDLQPEHRRTFESYMELEMTAAYLGERRRLRAAHHLFKSMLLKPRLQLSTADFWERSNQVPHDVHQSYKLLLAAVD